MRVLFILLAIFGCSIAGPQGIEDDLDVLLQNVTRINQVSIPGPLIAFGRSAFSVIGAKASGDGIPYGTVLPIVAASRRDNGRIVVFGMERYFYSAEYTIPLSETDQLILNSFLWATRSNTTTKRVGLHEEYLNLANILHFNGFYVSLISETLFDTHAFMDQYDLIITDLNIITALQASNLDTYLRLGGGVVTGSTGYRENNDVFLSEWQGNNFLRRCGICFMGVTTYAGPVDGGVGFNASRVWVQDTNSYPSWQIIKDHIVNGTPIEGGNARLAQLLEVVELAVRR